VIVAGQRIQTRAGVGRGGRRGYIRGTWLSRWRAQLLHLCERADGEIRPRARRLKIMPAFCPVPGRTRMEALAKDDELQALIDLLAGLGSLYGSFGDLSGLSTSTIWCPTTRVREVLHEWRPNI